jgi:ribosome-binding protein aMBF1 (putative translation factor)
MKSWTILERQLLKNPAIKAESEKLEAEYQLARQLIKARVSQNLTQAELAEKAGVKQAYIARLESGSANPTIDSLNKVAKVLDLRLKLA